MSFIVTLREAIDSYGGSVGWNLGRACEELNLYISPAYAARLFHRATGMGIREYIKKQRLQSAAKRLATTELSIKIIATELGYQQASDLARFFKKQQRLSPAKFRRTDS